MPIMLPDGAFERQFPNLEVRPNDDCPVALLCWRCKRVDIFSPQQSSPYYDPGWQKKECFLTGDTEFLLPLQCEGGNCEFRVPLFVTWSVGTTVAEKEDRLRTLLGEHFAPPMDIQYIGRGVVLRLHSFLSCGNIRSREIKAFTKALMPVGAFGSVQPSNSGSNHQASCQRRPPG